MGEKRIVGPGKTRRCPYTVCKKNIFKMVALSIAILFGAFQANKQTKRKSKHCVLFEIFKLNAVNSAAVQCSMLARQKQNRL